MDDSEFREVGGGGKRLEKDERQAAAPRTILLQGPDDHCGKTKSAKQDKRVTVSFGDYHLFIAVCQLLVVRSKNEEEENRSAKRKKKQERKESQKSGEGGA